MEKFSVSLYTCSCGYKTTSAGNASRHKKVGSDHEVKVSSVSMILESDHIEALAKATASTYNGETVNVDNTVNNNNITNIQLVLPPKTTKEDFVDYLCALNGAGFRSPEQIMKMPGNLLSLTRDPKKYPGALVERNNKIVEKLPDGGERVMGKKKAVQTYTNEAIDALYLRHPSSSVSEFLEQDRGVKRAKMSIVDASKMRVENPHGYHNRVPEDVKHLHQKMETNTKECLDKITTENKDIGFL
ncbi:hypothetical protein MT325_M844R [Paramecium bursaria chlorella virus MT325]|jgi:hypothetical protein|uniref:Uncharacterized protein M844R n=1 Tax=Paramecium bursaria Chlorella virus MT325 TaxID=346932 RepID=A7IVM4_PBCVM|nr:hypothetical protein MT325_M844R [Paramecium bursaria chlorella virus MT325]